MSLKDSEYNVATTKAALDKMVLRGEISGKEAETFFYEYLKEQEDRNADPAVWECLADIQRDKIHAWYTEIRADEYAARKRYASRSWAASYFALIPFAVAWAYRANDGKITLYALLEAFCAWALYAIVFTLFHQFYERINTGKPSVIDTIFQVSGAVLASVCLAYLIYK